MPRVCEFYGILIYFYFRDHPPPHFHARYQGEDAVFDIESLQLIEGTAKPRVRALVVEWALQRRSELRRAWAQAASGNSVEPIAPLD